MFNFPHLIQKSNRFRRNSIPFSTIKTNKKISSEMETFQLPTQKDLKSYWNNFSKIYSKHMEIYTQPVLYSLLSNLDISNSTSILEASCGSGR